MKLKSDDLFWLTIGAVAAGIIGGAVIGAAWVAAEVFV